MFEATKMVLCALTTQSNHRLVEIHSRVIIILAVLVPSKGKWSVVSMVGIGKTERVNEEKEWMRMCAEKPSKERITVRNMCVRFCFDKKKQQNIQMLFGFVFVGMTSKCRLWCIEISTSLRLQLEIAFDGRNILCVEAKLEL